MTQRDESNGPRCEDCGAETESVTSFAYGGSGSSRSGNHCAHTSIQLVQPAPAMLGHEGYLCGRCWWGRSRLSAAAA
jgi:hypothetical protein